MRTRNKLLLLLSAITIVATSVMTIGFTYAAFSSKASVEQGTRINTQLGSPVYLSPGVWDNDGAEYYIYQWNSTYNNNDQLTECWVAPSKKLSDGKCVYYLQVGGASTPANDPYKFTNFMFVRLNPSRSGYSTTHGDDCWDKTSNLTYAYNNGSYINSNGTNSNIYYINGWGSGYIAAGSWGAANNRIDSNTVI